MNTTQSYFLKPYLTPKNYKLLGISIVSGIVLGGLLGYTVFLKYKSEAILNLDMGVAEYKRYSEAANNINLLSQALKSSPNIQDLDTDLIANHVKSSSGNSIWQKPVPRISKAEAKDLADVTAKIESDKQYVGVKISAPAKDADQAQRSAMWLGQYFKEAAAKEALRELSTGWISANTQFTDRAQEQKLRMQFDVQQAQERSKALKQVITQYPQASKQDQRQVVDVRKDNEKFISPMSQLLGAETEMIDIREKAARLDREIEQHTFSKPILLAVQLALESSSSGSEAIKKLDQLITAAQVNAKTDAQKERLLAYSSDVSRISARFLTQAQFVANPVSPERPEQPRPFFLAALLGFLSGLGALLWIFKDLIAQLFKQEDEVAPHA